MNFLCKPVTVSQPHLREHRLRHPDVLIARKKALRQNGFTLIEVVAALVLLAIIVLTLFALLSEGRLLLGKRISRSVEASTIQQVADYYRENPDAAVNLTQLHPCPINPDTNATWYECPSFAPPPLDTRTADQKYRQQAPVCCLRPLTDREKDATLPPLLIDKKDKLVMLRIWVQSSLQTLSHDVWINKP